MALTQWQLQQLAADSIASGDFLPFSDESETGDPLNKITVDNLATFFAGTGLTASGGVLNADAAQTQITSVGALNVGSITSGFGTIDNGANSITTTGTLGAGATTVNGNLGFTGARSVTTSTGDLTLFPSGNVIVPNNTNLVVGHSTTVQIGDSAIGMMITDANNANSGSLSVSNFDNANTPSKINFGKGNSDDVTNFAAITSGWGMGQINFLGADGTDLDTQSARIEAVSTGTIGTGRVPSILNFYTGTDAAPTVATLAMSLSAAQNATFGGNISIPATDKLYLDGGGDTYMVESSANVIDWYISGVNDMRLTYLAAGSELHVEGDIVAFSTTIASDERLKENITTLDSPLEQINKLRGVSFDWSKTGEHSMGVIAQEVEALYPYLVKENDLNGMKAVNYNALIGLLIEGIKELQK